MSTATIADLIEVELPSGAPFEVLNDDEAEFIEKLVDEYLNVFEFTHVADIADLDQLVYLELHLYRWARWSSRTCDYDGGKIDPHDLQRRIKDFQGERRQLKRNMGVDAITREKAKGEGSLPHFFAQLRERAKIFGVHRETQLDRALELTNQLIGIVTVWKNCFRGDTLVVTPEGAKPIKDLVGNATLLSAEPGTPWQTVEVRSFGVQPLYRIQLERRGLTKTIHTTAGHRWFRRPGRKPIGRDETTTLGLRPGDRLASCWGKGVGAVDASPHGVGHGLVFGDGHRPRAFGNATKLVLCGSKDELIKWFPLSPTRAIPTGIEVGNLPRSWKDPPRMDEAAGYLAGWLAGYIAADGHVSNGAVFLTSYNRANLEVAQDVAYRLGIPTLGIRERTFNGTYSATGTSTAYQLSFVKGRFPERFVLRTTHRAKVASATTTRGEGSLDWTVTSVTPTGTSEEVYCATNIGSFVLADYIATGNCVDDDERRQLHHTTEDVISWILEVYMPEYMEIDAHFREHQQRAWIREM